jgi:hypothetical protein
MEPFWRLTGRLIDELSLEYRNHSSQARFSCGKPLLQLSDVFSESWQFG